MPTLSDYFPPDTRYFYGYPAGDEAQFYNLVPPGVEELVSARPLVCSGEDLRILSFATAVRSDVRNLLRDLEVPIPGDRQIMSLPEAITESVSGSTRNAAVRRALREASPPGSLVMAQPYPDADLAETYQIDPALTLGFNDKKNMPSYIPAAYLPETFASYASGAAFAAELRTYAPCVVKISSSSAGDGVRLCKTSQEFQRAQADFSAARGDILVQEYIEAEESLGVQFAVPSDPAKPLEVPGVSRQIVSANGEFQGGVVMRDALVPASVSRALLTEILPAVRARGWYGVGGFDVLLTREGKPYFVDPNFRMTNMTAFVYESLNGIIEKNMVALSGTFSGSANDLKSIATMRRPDQLLNIVSLKRAEAGFAFNGALLFDQQETIRENAQALLGAGVQSSLLETMSKRSA